MDHFSDRAATWDEDLDNVTRAREVAGHVRAAVPLRPDMRVLEIGGGTGLLSRELAADIGTSVVTDVAPGMVAAASAALAAPEYAGWSARLLDVEHDTLPDERYDLVLGLLALHHMGDVRAVIDRCATLLAPGGTLVLVDLDRDEEGAFHAHVHDFHGHDGFARADVERWMAAAGLADVTLTPAGSVTKDVEGGPRDFAMFLASGRRPAG